MSKTVTFTITPEGEVKMDMENFHGVGCAEIANKFSDALGGKVTKEVIKDDYYRNNNNKNTLTSGR